MGEIGTKTYEINSFLVNPQKRLGLFPLLNILQDVGWKHASEFGQGHDDTIQRKTFWVLTRQNLEMETWPAWGTNVDVRTWIRPLEGMIAMRDYEVILDGKTIGRCTSGWILLDAHTRKPLKDGLAGASFPYKQGEVLSLDTPKIPALEKTEKLATFHVRNSDIDMNDHVNNTKYAQWILDAMPIEWHRQYRLRRYQINFIAEAKLGDTVEVGYANLQTTDGPTESCGRVQFQGLRANDNKPIFTAILDTVPIG